MKNHLACLNVLKVENTFLLSLVLFVTVFSLSGCASYYAKQHIEKGAVYLKANENESAIKEYQQALNYEKTAETNMALGEMYSQKGDCLSALKYYQAASKYETHKKQSLVKLAECYMTLKSYPASAESYVQAIELDPEDHKLTVSTAELWGNLDQDTGLIAWLDRIIVAQPKLHYGLAFKGNHFYRLAKWEQAKELYLKALAVFPRSPSVLLRLGSTFSKLGEYEKARENFVASLEIEEGENARLGIAVTYFMQRNFDKSLETLGTTLTKYKDSAEAHALAAQIYYMQDEYTEAYKHGEIAVKGMLNNALLLKLLGIIRTTEGKCSDALNWFKLHNQINNEDAEVYFGMGSCYAEDGNDLLAIASFNKVIYLDDKFFEAYKRLGILQYKTRDYHGSASKLQVAVEMLPNDGESFLYLGMANVELGIDGFDLADATLTEAARLLPDDPRSYAYLAAIASHLKDYKKAFAMLDKAVILGFSDSEFLKKSYFNNIRKRGKFIRASEIIEQNSLMKKSTLLLEPNPLVAP